MPEISVIVPVYNVEKYLARCIDSILAQTVKDFEVICVNDGSPDKCGEILKKYAVKDKRVRVVTQKNLGVSVARNNALKKATGKYICFVDSDDEIAPIFLERLYTLIKETKSDMVSCDYVQSTKTPKWDNFLEEESRIYDKPFEKYISEELNISASVWGKLFKKEILKTIVFDKNISIGEDLVYLYKCLCKTKKLVATSQKFYFYRTREDSAINSRFSKKIIDGNVATAVELKKYFNNKKMSPKTFKVLNQKIAKRIFKFCVLEPKRKDKKNLKKWYTYTKPLLRELKNKDVFQLKYLNFKNRMEAYLFLKDIK